jgi:hypothetical protein
MLVLRGYFSNTDPHDDFHQHFVPRNCVLAKMPLLLLISQIVYMATKLVCFIHLLHSAKPYPRSSIVLPSFDARNCSSAVHRVPSHGCVHQPMYTPGRVGRPPLTLMVYIKYPGETSPPGSRIFLVCGRSEWRWMMQRRRPFNRRTSDRTTIGRCSAFVGS